MGCADCNYPPEIPENNDIMQHSPARKNRHPGKRRAREAQNKTAQKLPRNSPDITAKIERIGAKGDGIGTVDYKINHQIQNVRIFVSGSLEGEVVQAKPHSLTSQGLHADLVELIEENPNRQTAPCPIFTRCGGCQLQHMTMAHYREWKQAYLKEQLIRADLHPDIWQKPFWGHEQTRRRASLTFRRTAEQCIIGFLERNSHFILPIDSCLILTPDLKATAIRLQKWGHGAFSSGMAGRIHINMLDDGADITLFPENQPTSEQLTHFASTGLELDCARLSVVPPDTSKPIVLLSPKAALLSDFDPVLAPPPGVFLQASLEGQIALQQAVTKASGDSKTLIDLFCGCGTFTLNRLKDGITLWALDIDSEAIDAFEAAARQSGYGQKAKFNRRNLLTAPLLAEEIKGYECVIMDPPRSGAQEQVEALIHSGVPKIVMISCNPQSLARDLSLLVQQGHYHLDWVQLIDQFVYSTHIEAVACLHL